MKNKVPTTLTAVFTQEKDGGYSVSVPSLPGCYSQGETLEEAQKNISEAVELYLDDADQETRHYLAQRRGEFSTSVTYAA